MTRDLHKYPRLYVSDSLTLGQLVKVTKEQAHYLTHVLRQNIGDRVRLFNGRDGDWLASLVIMKKQTVVLEPIQQTRQQTTEPDLWLCPAPIKKAHFDFMVMKATELGVSHIQPILTSRTQVREINTERLIAIAVEAAEQSERQTIPTIAEPQTLEQFCAKWPSSRLPLLCAEFGEAEPVGKYLNTSSPNPAQQACVITGPEGGFSDDELYLLRQLPLAKAVRLGPRILRADTAAIAALTCWQALYGDWR